MKTKLFSLLVGVFAFFASRGQSVILPAEVARFYRERHEEAKVLADDNKALEQEVANLEQQLQNTRQIIDKYQMDSLTYEETIQTKDKEISLNREQLDAANSEIRRQKIIKILSWAGTIILIIIL